MSRYLVYTGFVALYLAIGLVTWLDRQSVVATAFVGLLGFLALSFLQEIPPNLFRISILYSLCGGALASAYAVLTIGWATGVTFSALGFFLGLVYSPHFRERSRKSLFDRSFGTAAGGVMFVRFVAGANWTILFTVVLIIIVAAIVAVADWSFGRIFRQWKEHWNPQTQYLAGNCFF